MLIIDVEYLMGRVMASSYNDRSRPEYPPHPSRLFSALVAAYEECELGPEARKSLEWLEALPDPALYIDPNVFSLKGRDSVSYYVPVNDSPSAHDKKAVNLYRKQPVISPGIGLNRLRAERGFPAVTPNIPRVKFVWDVGNECDQYLPWLRLIAENLTYLGNSATPVAVRVTKGNVEPNVAPLAHGEFSLRTLGRGRLAYLEQVHKLREMNQGIQPRVGRVVKYGFIRGVSTDEAPSSDLGHYVTFRINSPQIIPGSAFYKVVIAARNSMLSLYPDPIPDIISGHHADGEPLKSPHLAVIPQLDIGHAYADGHVMGFSFILPRNVASDLISAMDETLSELTSIKAGNIGVLSVQRIAPYMVPNSPRGLNLRYYEGPSDSWATVTPMVFGKHPKLSAIGPGKDGGPVFREACQMANLPAPEEVITMPSGVFEGIGLARDFTVPQKFGSYLRMHAIIRFPEKVRGPLVVGSGRFMGYGLLRPFSGGY